MGKAKIVSHIAGSEYNIIYYHDMTVINKKIENINSDLIINESYNDELQIKINEKQDIVLSLSIELEVAFIPLKNCLLENIGVKDKCNEEKSAVNEINKKYMVELSLLDELKTVQSNAKLSSIQMNKDLDLYAGLSGEETKTSWCIDLCDREPADPDNGHGELIPVDTIVGTIDVFNFSNRKYSTNIKAASYERSPAYNSIIDGQSASTLANNGNGFVYNYNMRGPQAAWEPQYRLATIDSISDDVAQITYNNQTDLDGVKFNTMDNLADSDVSVDYMQCGESPPFESGDQVIVSFSGNKMLDPLIIGYFSNPQTCLCDGFALKSLIQVYYVENSGTFYDNDINVFLDQDPFKNLPGVPDGFIRYDYITTVENDHPGFSDVDTEATAVQYNISGKDINIVYFTQDKFVLSHRAITLYSPSISSTTTFDNVDYTSDLAFGMTAITGVIIDNNGLKVRIALMKIDGGTFTAYFSLYEANYSVCFTENDLPRFDPASMTTIYTRHQEALDTTDLDVCAAAITSQEGIEFAFSAVSTQKRTKINSHGKTTVFFDVQKYASVPDNKYAAPFQRFIAEIDCNVSIEPVSMIVRVDNFFFIDPTVALGVTGDGDTGTTGQIESHNVALDSYYDDNGDLKYLLHELEYEIMQTGAGAGNETGFYELRQKLTIDSVSVYSETDEYEMLWGHLVAAGEETYNYHTVNRITATVIDLKEKELLVFRDKFWSSFTSSDYLDYGMKWNVQKTYVHLLNGVSETIYDVTYENNLNTLPFRSDINNPNTSNSRDKTLDFERREQATNGMYYRITYSEHYTEPGATTYAEMRIYYRNQVNLIIKGGYVLMQDITAVTQSHIDLQTINIKIVFNVPMPEISESNTNTMQNYLVNTDLDWPIGFTYLGNNQYVFKNGVIQTLQDLDDAGIHYTPFIPGGSYPAHIYDLKMTEYWE